ncbi:50S ribosomal protein L21 [Candidatus Gottesmanbacteria bacterium RIFCSPLOWO2_02_FULL_38_8]|uniref:Large ribosomal subunit protein bL21 n=1 Tax=Candidatus Gottesmanbacteria bacterium RIFCSPLOWO2_02_FULL_38_8 TaxID=1798397 RepID=A0A1F6B2J1_9BACT|nr:MAG: 50S ribosomal protein L21 [Candidatus Gottesmanbacteria bacterium RIFCSPLOWO2_02_FULL_38_8]
MKSAIADIGGKQYILNPGKIVTVDKVPQKEGEKYNFEKILLVRMDDSLLIGSPFVTAIKLSGKIIRQYKGDKIQVMKFKSKVHYRRKIGFRPYLTDIEVNDIKAVKKIS